jgi:TonB family protein
MRLISVGLLAMVACSRSAPPPNPTATAPAEESPVALNAEPAVQYPPDLYERGVEGDVVLRLYVDSTGRLSPDSTRVSESSGSAGLDSAAVRGVSHLRYAPARRNGLPVSTAFLQTVQFRHAAGAAALNRGPTTPVAAPPRPDSSATPRRAARPAPDTTAARRATAPRPDTTAAPPVPVKPAAPDTTSPDTTRARPDSNGVQH